MNRKKFHCLLIVAAGAAGLFQWWQHSRLVALEAGLRGELAGLKSVVAQTSRTPAGAGGLAAAAGAEAGPFEVGRFVAGLEALAPFLDADGQPRDEASREQLTQKALPLFAQIVTAPPDLLRQAMERILASQALPGRMKGELLHPILVKLAETEPAWAADQALKARPGSPTLENVLQVWAGRDTAAALAWIDREEKQGSLTNVGVGERAYLASALREKVAAGQASADPAAVVDKLAQMPPGQREEAALAAARALKSPAERSRVLEQLASVSTGSTAPLHNFALTLCQHSGFQASREALEAASLPPAAHDTAAAAIVTGSIGVKTEEKASWLLASLRGDDPVPLRDFVGTWATADFNGAAAWLQHLPPTARRDAAVAAFATRVVEKEPASAVDWAGTIHDTTVRTRALNDVWQAWREHAPAEAAAYFKAKGLPAPE